jgi:hypothetical protein
LSVFDTEIVNIRRPAGAENGDPDGSAIYIEGAGNHDIVVERSTIQNGSYIGIWMEANNLTVTATTFNQFAYGIYMAGDQGSAAGRRLNVSGCSFSNMANWSILANSNATITASDVTGTMQPAIQVRAPGGEISISGNIISGVMTHGILAGGNTIDGRATSTQIVGNTITDVTAGNGILVLDSVTAVIADNIVSDIDHAYFRDPENPAADGSIVNGYGIACFRSASCQLSGNDISEVEFASIVIVEAAFEIVEDFVHGSYWNGIHVEQSQGTIKDVQLRDNRGTAIYLFESTVVGSGVTIADTVRGPLYSDIDGNMDPLPEDLLFSYGGWGVESRSGGAAPAYLEWRDGTFDNTAYGGIYSFRGQVIIDGNVMTDTGVVDEENTFSQGAISLIQGPENMVSPIIEVTNNDFYGSAGSNLVTLSSTPGAVVRNNTFCGGTSVGLVITNSDATVGNNTFGTDDDGNPACDDLTWSQGMQVSGTDLDLVDLGSVIEDNVLVVPAALYGIRITGIGPTRLENNSINGGTVAGIDSVFSPPTQLYTDRDGDGLSPWSGDCDDTDPTIAPNQPEIPDDGIDNDCDPLTPDSAHPSEEDLDQDGFSVAEGDCHDGDPTRAPDLPELLGNWIDDDCDGWADNDATDMPFPELTLLANTISGSSTGLSSQGAIFILDEAETSPVGNRIENVSNYGIEVRGYFGQGVVARGSFTLSPATEIDTTGSDCIRTSAAGASVVLTGGTLTACGGAGLSIQSGGSIRATGTTIDGAAANGVNAFAGTIVLDGVTITSPGQAGISVAGSADVDGSNVVVTGAVGAAVQVLGGDLDLTGGGLNSLATVTFVQSAGLGALDGVDIVGAQTGVRVTGGTLSITGGTIDDATVEGIHGDAGTLIIDGTDIDNAAGDGIRLDAGVSASVEGAILTNNGGFGLSCDGVVTLSVCTATASNNTAGDFQQINGCDVPANAVCAAP